jgi:bis(5'-nucleosyl)-tetraphosphatase (symmetrical)
MAIYVVGDIQGCYDPLRHLLDKIRFDPDTDRLWCVGDLVNRGPDSLAVLRFLKSLGESCICVLGNHDLHLLERACGGRVYARDTFDDVLQAPDRDELIDWLRHRPLLHHDEALGWCMVHAGLHPDWRLKDAREFAASIEAALRSNDWHDFCCRLHHKLFPPAWPDMPPEQLVFATAVLTRARYCTQDGYFDWSNRTGDPVSPGDKPWFVHDTLAWRGDCHIVYGHWAAAGLVDDQPHVLGLDSGCIWGGKLTAARLDGVRAEIIQVECEACQRHDT